MTDINERIAILRGWEYSPLLKRWCRGHLWHIDAPPYTTDPALILELVEDKKISVRWSKTHHEWCAWALGGEDFAKSWDVHYGTAVALAWLAGEEE